MVRGLGSRRALLVGAGHRGHTFVELLVTSAILIILASAIVPMASVTRKRQKELELRAALREIRNALDMYHELCRASIGQGQPQPGPITHLRIALPEGDLNLECWPKELELLVEGIETNIPDYKVKFLRRIPRDPFNVEDDERDAFGWRLRSTTDNPGSSVGWDRQNVFDVSSGSENQALDNSYYKEW